jgi:hypothetical protein
MTRSEPGPPLEVILRTIVAAAARAARQGATITQLERAARAGYVAAFTVRSR